MEIMKLVVMILLMEMILVVVTCNSRLQRNAVKTIQSEDGDVIECIDIYKQPAFDHPALRNHNIQMAPSYIPKVETQEKDGGRELVRQLWQKSGSCPNGTIPIRKDMHEFAGRKPPYETVHHDNNQTKDNIDIKLLYKNRAVAMLHAEINAYYGAKGSMMVFNPFIDLKDDYSVSHIALKNGPRDDFEGVESGWAVNPRVYKDKRTRFYTYWTADGSRKTGCFDHTCPGFVQTSSEIALGAVIYPISTDEVPSLPMLSEIKIFIYKDPHTRNWWVQYNDKSIGYFAGELFSALKIHASLVEMGGEVYSTRVGVHPHTGTGMGSGAYSFPTFGTSGSVRFIRVLLGSNVVKYPDYANAYADEYRCYDTWLNPQRLPDPEFFFGGPGSKGWDCP